MKRGSPTKRDPYWAERMKTIKLQNSYMYPLSTLVSASLENVIHHNEIRDWQLHHRMMHETKKYQKQTNLFV